MFFLRKNKKCLESHRKPANLPFFRLPTPISQKFDEVPRTFFSTLLKKIAQKLFVTTQYTIFLIHIMKEPTISKKCNRPTNIELIEAIHMQLQFCVKFFQGCKTAFHPIFSCCFEIFPCSG